MVVSRNKTRPRPPHARRLEAALEITLVRAAFRVVFTRGTREHGSRGKECKYRFTTGARSVCLIALEVCASRRARVCATFAPLPPRGVERERERASERAAPLYISWKHEARGTPRVFHDVSSTPTTTTRTAGAAGVTFTWWTSSRRIRYQVDHRRHGAMTRGAFPGSSIAITVLIGAAVFAAAGPVQVRFGPFLLTSSPMSRNCPSLANPTSRRLRTRIRVLFIPRDSIRANFAAEKRTRGIRGPNPESKTIWDAIQFLSL